MSTRLTFHNHGPNDLKVVSEGKTTCIGAGSRCDVLVTGDLRVSEVKHLRTGEDAADAYNQTGAVRAYMGGREGGKSRHPLGMTNDHDAGGIQPDPEFVRIGPTDC
jgi:hypothetical protein